MPDFPFQDPERAEKIALELAKSNIENANRWVPAAEVTSFVKTMYDFLMKKENSN